MRVVLVGSESDRARLRARMNGSMTVVGEFESLGAVRAAGLAADAILLAPLPVASGFSRTEPLARRCAKQRLKPSIATCSGFRRGATTASTT